jgi:hypothetical protein
MTVQKLKLELRKLKEFLQEKKETPWDCKLLMMQFEEESTRRYIIQKIYSVAGEAYDEPGPIELHYFNFGNLSPRAQEFLALSDEEKKAVILKELPPKHISKEEAEERKRQLMAKLNLMGDRLRHDNNTTN